MNYISEIIGDQYKEWRAGESIYISSQTGTGKTSFIINDLVKYYAAYDMKILYLVNRSALEKQLKSEIKKKLDLNEQRAITVTTYQVIEEIYNKEFKREVSIDFMEGYTAGKEIPISVVNEQLHKSNLLSDFQFQIDNTPIDSFDCIVCDECHYFLADSNFNTRTIFSYNFVRQKFSDKVRVFISATMDDIHDRIRKDLPLFWAENFKKIDVMRKHHVFPIFRTDWFGFNTGIVDFSKEYDQPYVNYSTSRKYDYVDIGIVKNENEIVDLIYQDDNRWLIFVDSKALGNSLKHAISKKGKELIGAKLLDKEKKIIFITADYCSSEENLGEYMRIVENQKQSADILISTQTLDNGISLSNSDLTNIIIMADNETEFIQMLGRKRVDGERINLYLYKYEKGHFVNRLTAIDRKLEFAGKVYNSIYSSINQLVGSCTDFNYMNYVEKKQMVFWHKELMQDIHNQYDIIKDAFVTVGNYLFLNPLSLFNMMNLKAYYGEIIKSFGEDASYDEDAFLKEQMKWLRLEDEEDLVEAKKSREERAKDRMLKCIEDKINGNKNRMSEEECIKFQKEIAPDFIILINHSDLPQKKKVNMIKNVKQPDRPLTGPQMTWLRETYEFPYALKASGGIWEINRFKK